MVGIHSIEEVYEKKHGSNICVKSKPGPGRKTFKVNWVCCGHGLVVELPAQHVLAWVSYLAHKRAEGKEGAEYGRKEEGEREELAPAS